MTVKLAWIFAVVLIVIGILGFVPGIASGGMLLGLFMVGTLHNLIHLVTGIIALVVAKKGEAASKTFFKVFGVIYAVVALVGFIQGTTVLGLIDVGMSDNVLHLVIAVVALWAGFKKAAMAAPAAPTTAAPTV